jgi:hypothetical protein
MIHDTPLTPFSSRPQWLASRVAALSCALFLSIAGTYGQGKGGGKPGGGGGEPGDSPAIAYVASDPSTFIAKESLKVMNASGGSQREVYTASGLIRSPSWHPEGQHLLFTHSPRNGTPALYWIGINGKGLVKLTDLSLLSGEAQVSPIPGPSGKRQVVFTDRYFHQDGSSAPALFVINDDGTGRRVLRAPESMASFSSPVWSPDGLHIACYYEAGAGAREIRLLATTVDDQGRLIVENETVLFVFAPDGLEHPLTRLGSLLSFARNANKIYFSAGPDYNRRGDQIWALHLNSDLEPDYIESLQPPLGSVDCVSGAPDDGQIAYGFSYVDGMGTWHAAIAVSSNDGSSPVILPRPISKGRLENQFQPAFKR